MFGRKLGEGGGRGVPPDVRVGGPPYIDPKPEMRLPVLPENALGHEISRLRTEADQLGQQAYAGGAMEVVRKRQDQIEKLRAEAERLEKCAQAMRAGDTNAIREVRTFFETQRAGFVIKHQILTAEMANAQQEQTPDYQQCTAWAALREQAKSLATAKKRKPNPFEQQALMALSAVMSNTRYGRSAREAEELEREMARCDALIANLNQRS